MEQTIYQVDAFAERAFTGNPAAVCVLDNPLPDALMQNIALEMNQAETAFVERRGDGSFGLRWFTPTVEVDLCGHATLASAFVLWHTGVLAAEATAQFHTRSGLLKATQDQNGITLDFPAEVVTATTLPEIEKAVLASVVFVGKNRMDYLVEVKNEAAVRDAVPDMNRIAAFDCRGMIVTAQANTGQNYDFVSRFFAPASGVAEDHVTGSAHCALAPYWRDKLGKDSLVGYQSSRRGGIVRTVCQADRVLLTGNVVLTLTGTLYLPD